MPGFMSESLIGTKECLSSHNIGSSTTPIASRSTVSEAYPS